MARAATAFVCSACAHEAPKWHGRCPSCGEWNSLVEEARGTAPSGREGAGAPKGPVSHTPRPAQMRGV
ncbi:MAG: DNA repair protein RadA, partial [Solirubrobacteraceae bacterium]